MINSVLYTTHIGEGCLLGSPPSAVHRIDASAAEIPSLYLSWSVESVKSVESVESGGLMVISTS